MGEKYCYVRFIDSQNYEKQSHRDGALYADSVWYEEETYAQTLTEALGRLETQNPGSVVYRFTADAIRASRDYVKRQGQGNSLNPSGLKQWLDLFAPFRGE